MKRALGVVIAGIALWLGIGLVLLGFRGVTGRERVPRPFGTMGLGASIAIFGGIGIYYSIFPPPKE